MTIIPISQFRRRGKGGQAPTPDEMKAAWENPDLWFLGSGRRRAPKLPSDPFRPFWYDWLTRAADSVSAPIDYSAVSLLVAVGATIANVRWPLAGANWSEPPIQWGNLVGFSAQGKSPGMGPILRLMVYSEDQMARDFAEEVRQYETQKYIAKAKHEHWETLLKQAIKEGKQPPPKPKDAEPPRPPVRPRIITVDSTIESLAALALALPRGLLLHRDELEGWFGSFDRYGGNGRDEGFAKEMFGGRLYRVDRKNSPEPLFIRHLSIGVLGSSETDKIADIIGNSKGGLIPRFNHTWPEELPDFKLSRSVFEDDDARTAFARLTLLPMNADEFGYPEPKRVKLSTKAEDVIEAFGATVKTRISLATGTFATSLGKARGHALRLAAILEFLWWCEKGLAEPTEISLDAVNAAITLVSEYFLPMAERVYGDAAIPERDAHAMILTRRLQQEGLGKFNARDLRRRMGSPIHEAEAMDEACKVLHEAGLIRPQPERKGATGGRHSKDFEVSPRIFRQ
jgi:hypothetical protein